VHYYDSFKHEGSLIIVCEWAAAGDLKRQIQKIVTKGKFLSELNIWKYFQQIASAVQYMHSHRILHRDLKPANILLTAEGQIKVTDFGLSRGVSNNTAVLYSKVGTPLYMAPEVIIGKGYGCVSGVPGIPKTLAHAAHARMHASGLLELCVCWYLSAVRGVHSYSCVRACVLCVLCVLCVWLQWQLGYK
jgi:serine/threonine protein kinase